MEVFCTELKRTSNSNDGFRVAWPQGVLKRKIEPGHELYVGIVEFLRHTDDRSPRESYKEFRITIPASVPVADNYGSHFEMGIRIVSRNGPAQNIRFQFGVMDEKFYIKELSSVAPNFAESPQL